MKLATATAALWMIMKSSRTVLSTGNWSLINSLAVAPLLMIFAVQRETLESFLERVSL